MLKSYIKVALRSLQKNKLYTAVNIAGLTVGIAGCIFIGLYIWNELSYDRFHKNGDRIVRMNMEYAVSGSVSKMAVCGTKAGPQLTRTFPSIEDFTRTYKVTRTVAFGEKAFDEDRFLYADSGFFRIFSFPLLEGDARTALDAPRKMVITQRMARKYFGSEDPMGKTLRIGGAKDYLVTGVAADPPGNSQIQFDFVGSFASLGVAQREDWWTANYVTYLLLHQPGQEAALQRDITGYMKVVDKEQLHEKGNDYMTYWLEPLFSVHLHSSTPDGLEPAGSMTDIYVLGTVALLILLIACVNYTNLATAQSAGRGTEIAVRKVLGAGGGQLFGQFMGESAVLTGIALVLAILITILSLPAFDSLTGQSFTAGMFLKPVPLAGLIILGILISFMAGSYPAFILSGSEVIGMLKSGIRIASSGGGLRKSLIVFQFVVSVFLVIATIVVMRQLSYIRHKDLGYNKDHVIILPMDYIMRPDAEALKNAIRQSPEVLSVGGAYQSPVSVGWGDGVSGDDGSGQKTVSVNALPADVDFIPTLGMTLLAGSNFDRNDYAKMLDTAHPRAFYIVNEQLAKAFGWTPEQAIGKTITRGTPGTIVGVVKDFHYTSMHAPIGKMVLFLDTSMTNDLFVRVSGNNIPSTLQFLSTVWKERVDHRPFQYRFLDDDFAALYVSEEKAAKVFELFAALAITLACMGLFAMAAFATVQRTREIGIRKVLGASLGDIVVLVSSDFVRLVVLGILIATPLAWFAAHRWLQDFAYRVSIEWWVFVAAAVASLLIAVLTVAYHAVRAGSANPIKSLKTE